MSRPATRQRRHAPRLPAPTRRLVVRDATLAISDRRPTVVTGVPLVWGHGLGSSMAHEDHVGIFDWSQVTERRRVVRFDARGHGASETTPLVADYEWTALADDVIALLDGLEIERAVIGGTSMGAAVSLQVACRAPERVAGLVLALPPTAWSKRSESASAYTNAARLVERRGLDELIAASRQRLIDSGTPRWVAEVWRSLHDCWGPGDERRLPLVFRGASLSDLPPPGALSSIVVPTLVLGWEGDEFHPVSTTRALGQLMVGAFVDIARDPWGLERWHPLVRGLLHATDIGHHERHRPRLGTTGAPALDPKQHPHNQGDMP